MSNSSAAGEALQQRGKEQGRRLKSLTDDDGDDESTRCPYKDVDNARIAELWHATAAIAAQLLQPEPIFKLLIRQRLRDEANGGQRNKEAASGNNLKANSGSEQMQQ